jgi:hypothetical protein
MDEVVNWVKRRQVELQKADPEPQWFQSLPPSAHICDVLHREFVAGLPAEQPCEASQHKGHDVLYIVEEPFRPKHISWKYDNPKTQLFWVRGLDAEKIRAMKGKCLLCNTDQHRLYTCPMRHDALRRSSSMPITGIATRTCCMFCRSAYMQFRRSKFICCSGRLGLRDVRSSSPAGSIGCKNGCDLFCFG